MGRTEVDELDGGPGLVRRDIGDRNIVRLDLPVLRVDEGIAVEGADVAALGGRVLIL